MSTEPDETGRDGANLPTVDDDVTSTGAAADSAEIDERLKALPRILRYAMLVSDSGAYIWQRLVAEIDELCPGLPLNAAWAGSRDAGLGVALGIELDHRAVKQDQLELRSLADCVRLLSLPVPRDSADLHDHRRVAKTLLQALGNLERGTDAALLADLEVLLRVGSSAGQYRPAAEDDGADGRGRRYPAGSPDGRAPHRCRRGCGLAADRGQGKKGQLAPDKAKADQASKAPVVLMPTGALLAGAVEQSLADVLPDGLRPVEADGISPLDSTVRLQRRQETRSRC